MLNSGKHRKKTKGGVVKITSLQFLPLKFITCVAFHKLEFGASIRRC